MLIKILQLLLLAAVVHLAVRGPKRKTKPDQDHCRTCPPQRRSVECALIAAGRSTHARYTPWAGDPRISNPVDDGRLTLRAEARRFARRGFASSLCVAEARREGVRCPRTVLRPGGAAGLCAVPDDEPPRPRWP